ncbi:MAG: serine/threonine protein kinase [Calditrichaeota bacterium]|nr:MAG: serine/threonine protein kinase [Calditrichota bacterium]MBL1205931.1 serine/threonine protein kinase [Calditrichota bacterium]NOG45759.1 serine/threonine protein kinase [Calditrichota bacterium]
MTSEQWQLIKTLFQEMLDLPETERESYLSKNCDDNDVREKVSQMLSAHSESEDFLETHSLEVNMFSESDESAARYIGRQIGLYKIEKHIGEGGMGNVFLAERDDDFHKKVALKIIKRGMDTDALLKRFRQERQILANLVHPNIARLLDGGSTEDGLPYLVMEYIEGMPITDYCDKEHFTINQRLKIFRKICQAINYAHQNLVVHRDIKPNNIIVTSEGVPKLLDFGIAKLLDPDTGESHELTIEGSRISTPEYASPEQIQGKPISTASDVYSLGILLYNLLTGYRPYHFLDRSPAAIEKVVVETIPAKPSSVLKQPSINNPTKNKTENVNPDEQSRLRKTSVEKLIKQLNGDLDNIILKSIQKEPQRRYLSIEQFSEDIGRYQNELPVSARKDSTSYRVGKFIRRHRVSFAAVIIIFLSLLSGIVGISWQAQIAKEEEVKARQTLKFVEKTLAAANPLESGKELTVEQLLDEATKRIPNELNEQPQIESEIRSIVGEAYQSLGHYGKARTHFKKNLVLLESFYGSKNSAVANGYRELAVVEHYSGNYSRADSLYRKAIKLYREIGEVTSGDYAIALNDFGTMELDEARYDSAIIVFEESLKLMHSFFGENHYQVGSVYNNLAYAYDDLGDYDKADSIYAKALSVFRHNYGDEHPEIANTLNNYAFVKLNVGDTLASLQLHEQALAMWRKLVGDDNPEVATTQHNIAAVTFYQKNYALAEKKEREVVKIFQKIYDAGHPYLGSAYFMMGRILNAREKFIESEEFLRNSLKIRQAKLGANHPAIASAYFELGKSLFGQNDLGKAKEMLKSAEQIYSVNGEAEKDALKKTRVLLEKLNI